MKTSTHTVLDDVRVVALPEPSPLAILGIGAVMGRLMLRQLQNARFKVLA